MKRIFDILVSLFLSVILLPAILLFSILVKTTSPGPVFYSQLRVGKKGKLFRILKFRTMHWDAPEGISLTLGDRDPRLTPIGVWMKKIKADEIPQLFNVLKGDMSLVGPRPEVSKYVNLYNDKQLKVLSLRPGITDRASIKYRHESRLLAESENPGQLYINHIMPDKLSINLKYVENHCMHEDICILAATVRALMK